MQWTHVGRVIRSGVLKAHRSIHILWLIISNRLSSTSHKILRQNSRLSHHSLFPFQVDKSINSHVCFVKLNKKCQINMLSHKNNGKKTVTTLRLKPNPSCIITRNNLLITILLSRPRFPIPFVQIKVLKFEQNKANVYITQYYHHNRRSPCSLTIYILPVIGYQFEFYRFVYFLCKLGWSAFIDSTVTFGSFWTVDWLLSYS